MQGVTSSDSLPRKGPNPMGALARLGSQSRQARGLCSWLLLAAFCQCAKGTVSLCCLHESQRMGLLQGCGGGGPR